MNLDDSQDECKKSSRQRYISKIDEICAKYSKRNKPEDNLIIDIRDGSIIKDDDDGSPLFCEDKKEYGRDQNKFEYCSESDDEDYVDSSYNDGRCSSSLASSNCEGKESPPTLKVDEICPDSYFSRLHVDSKKMQTRASAKDGVKEKKGKGSLVKIENTDVFVDIFRSAEFQKNKFVSSFFEYESEPFEDDFADTKSTEYGKRYKRDTRENSGRKKNGDLLGKRSEVLPKTLPLNSTAISRETDFKIPFRNSKLSPILLSSNKLQHKNDKDSYDPIAKSVSFNSTAFSRKLSQIPSSPSTKKHQNNDEDNYDVCLLEEPDYNQLKEEGMFTVDRTWSKNKLQTPCSSTCSFETDSLNSPMNEYRSYSFI